MSEIKVIGKFHTCNNWLPTAEKDKEDLVIECVCGRNYFCIHYGRGEYSWAEYKKRIVDSIDGRDIRWLDDVNPS